ncbi:MAG: hypothetical protein WAN18_14465 [Candidatus Sulfotelmatobacter sp.]
MDDQHYPGWLECAFIDVEGRRHTLIDKVPVFNLNDLDSKSSYPQLGGLHCEVLKSWRNSLGRGLVRITIDKPFVLESTEELSEFVVLATQLPRRIHTENKTVGQFSIAFLNPAATSDHLVI